MHNNSKSLQNPANIPTRSLISQPYPLVDLNSEIVCGD